MYVCIFLSLYISIYLSHSLFICLYFYHSIYLPYSISASFSYCILTIFLGVNYPETIIQDLEGAREQVGFLYSTKSVIMVTIIIGCGVVSKQVIERFFIS